MIDLVVMYAAFTVDVDRDVNLPVRGRIEGISRDPYGNGSPRFVSCARGLELLIDLLEEIGVRGTFFLETRAALEISRSVDVRVLLKDHEIASHGVDHEDLTGEKTGIPLSRDHLYSILERSYRELKEFTGREPLGFRAPYLQINEDVLESVKGAGFIYDSSFTVPLADEVKPWYLPNGLIEVPLITGHDDNGKKIYSYLWAMHEGRRSPDDYLKIMERMRSGLFVLATHSWHIVETFNKGRLGTEDIKSAVENVKSILEGAKDMGIEFITIGNYLKRFLSG